MVHPAPRQPGTNAWGDEVDAALADAPHAYATGGEVRSRGLPNGLDQTALVQAELDALVAGGGGTLLLPTSPFGNVPIKVTHLTLANDGATPPTQPPITIRGTGPHWSGRGTAPVGGSILEFTGTDTYGLLKTNGLGLLRCEGVTFRNTGSGTTPFVYTTNTTLHIEHCAFVGSKAGAACDQDAIVCGGLTAVEGAGGWNDGFQGYGTVISKNFFSGIRRAVYGRTFFNANTIKDNTVWNNCGHTGGAAFELDGDAAGTAGGSSTVGNVISDNLIELSSYKWGIRLRYAAANIVRHNSIFDPTTANASAGVRVESVAQVNTVLSGFTDDRAVPIDDQSGTTLFTSATPGIYSVAPATKFLDPGYPTMIARLVVLGSSDAMLIQPTAARSDSAAAFELKRSAAEATNPGASVCLMYQSGKVLFDPTAEQAGEVTGPFSKWTSGGRAWSGVGNRAGQENGSDMTQDSGPGGSYMNFRNYAARFYDWNSGPLRMKIGAGIDGFTLGSASDATVQRAAAGIVNLGKLAVTNSAAATTPGSVTKKIEVFDAAGASLGFIAVYDSIT